MSNLYHETLQNTDFTILPEKPIGKPDPIQSLTELNIDLKLGDLHRCTKEGKCIYSVFSIMSYLKSYGIRARGKRCGMDFLVVFSEYRYFYSILKSTRR